MKLTIDRLEPGYISILYDGEPHTVLSLITSIAVDKPEVELVGYHKYRSFEEKSRFQMKLADSEDDVLEIFKVIADEAVKITKDLQKKMVKAFENVSPS